MRHWQKQTQERVARKPRTQCTSPLIAGLRRIYLPGFVTAYVKTDEDVMRVTREAINALIVEPEQIRSAIRCLHR